MSERMGVRQVMRGKRRGQAGGDEANCENRCGQRKEPHDAGTVQAHARAGGAAAGARMAMVLPRY